MYLKDMKHIVWRLYNELTEKLELDYKIPVDAQQMISNFSTFLSLCVSKAAKSKRRLLIVLDGVDELDEEQDARSLWWIPGVIGLEP